MAKLEINASDLLGKLHLAAVDKVNSEFKGVLGTLKKLVKSGGIGSTSIENTAFDSNSGRVNLPKDKAAQIRVWAAGTNARKTCRNMAATYMKWFAGIQNFDIVKYIDDDKRSGTRTSDKDEGTILGQGVAEYTIDYQLTYTEKAAKDLEDAADVINKTGDSNNGGNKSSSSSSSSSSSVLNANESIEIKKVWESHPFESLFGQKENNAEMINEEANTRKFVKQISKKQNAKAQETLESIIKEKMNKRIKEVLATQEES